MRKRVWYTYDALVTTETIYLSILAHGGPLVEPVEAVQV